MSPERTVLVVSSDRLLGEAVAEYLDAAEGWRAPPPLRDGLRALAAIARDPPEAVLVLGDPDRLGAATLAGQVARRWPALPVVAVAAGMPESAAAVVLPPDTHVADVVGALAREPGRAPGAAAGREQPDAVRLLRTLTPQERRVLKLVGQGRSLLQVAEAIGVSQHTARTHLQHLYEKLDCHSRVEVVLFAVRYGIVATGAPRPKTPDRGHPTGGTYAR